MRIVLIIAALSLLMSSTYAQVEIEIHNLDVDGTENDGHWWFTYDTGTYDSLETTIDTNVGSGNIWWWGNESAAQSIADATNRDGLRFAHGETTISGVGDMVAYRDTNTSDLTLALQTQAGQEYVISASRVPAPLPILGVLPVVGFLRKMRRKQQLISK